MKNLTLYHNRIKASFNDYLSGKDVGKLIKNLREVEQSAKRDAPKDPLACLWMRFFPDDTMAHTINNIDFALRFDTKSNRKYIENCMEMAVDSEIEVFYS